MVSCDVIQCYVLLMSVSGHDHARDRRAQVEDVSLSGPVPLSQPVLL